MLAARLHQPRTARTWPGDAGPRHGWPSRRRRRSARGPSARSRRWPAPTAPCRRRSRPTAPASAVPSRPCAGAAAPGSSAGRRRSGSSRHGRSPRRRGGPGPTRTHSPQRCHGRPRVQPELAQPVGQTEPDRRHEPVRIHSSKRRQLHRQQRRVADHRVDDPVDRRGSQTWPRARPRLRRCRRGEAVLGHPQLSEAEALGVGGGLTQLLGSDDASEHESDGRGVA